MIKKFQTYIGQEPWEEAIKRQDRQLRRVMLVVILLSMLYFTPALVAIFTR